MDFSTIKKLETIEVINLASDSSVASPSRIITGSSPKDFMNRKPTAKKHIDTIVSKIRPNNQELISPNVQLQHIEQSDSETDYANIITIKKVDRKPPSR